MAETPQSFGERLQEHIHELGPLCVGVDPSAELLLTWERTDTVEGLEFFSLAVLEAVIGVAVAIKPQVAFFERFGAQGYRVLERLITDARDAQLLVVADAKRGDFANTNEGYAEAWLSDRSPLAVDAVTAHPYLGVGALSPLFDSRDVEWSRRLRAGCNVEQRGTRAATSSDTRPRTSGRHGAQPGR